MKRFIIIFIILLLVSILFNSNTTNTPHVLSDTEKKYVAHAGRNIRRLYIHKLFRGD